MLRQTDANDPARPRNRRRERRLWHDTTRPMLPLGCVTCPERMMCGGLRLGLPLFDCLDLCCGKPEMCDKVCRNHPEYANRVREIDTFSLETVPRAAAVPAPVLPCVVPVLFHGNCRDATIAPSAVALSLYRMFNRRDGSPRFSSHEALCAAYGVAPGTRIILTATDLDPPLERWWGLGEAQRRMIIRALRAIGVVLTTTPNYSLFINVPRWDDLHAMKRIGLVHWEFLDEGLPVALHVNGRTETDFRRWTDYGAARPEVTHLAYEFTTGTGRAGRREQHAAWLADLGAAVGRPLDLLVRGGVEIVPELAKVFARVTVLETSIFMKTMMRQRAVPISNARVGWQPAPTLAGAPLDALFAENLTVVEAWLSGLVAPTPVVAMSSAATA